MLFVFMLALIVRTCDRVCEVDTTRYPLALNPRMHGHYAGKHSNSRPPECWDPGQRGAPVSVSGKAEQMSYGVSRNIGYTPGGVACSQWLGPRLPATTTASARAWRSRAAVVAWSSNRSASSACAQQTVCVCDCSSTQQQPTLKQRTDFTP